MVIFPLNAAACLLLEFTTTPQLILMLAPYVISNARDALAFIIYTQFLEDVKRLTERVCSTGPFVKSAANKAVWGCCSMTSTANGFALYGPVAGGVFSVIETPVLSSFCPC